MQNKNLINKITDLESKLAFQEVAIEELNHELINQQQEILYLTKQLQQITEQLKNLSPSNLATFSSFEKPPHY